MARKNFDENKWTIEKYINDVPIEEYSEEERDNLFRKMLIDAVHSIGFVFEGEISGSTTI